ncbi:SDR family NAD(P)-dependent oxidoreductase [Pseudonocardia sp. TRM90224]|uniref:SDR family NAD(P)-dependent oxidoreductase n=1 Tax=Pseudonocardia sp. TRM90224 TaxID=2812678 RepID=UPI001E2BEB17|nr:SDR family NAD(P)-dependent oxidoreductase [Pseudonocardia sp. TRM90224]
MEREISSPITVLAGTGKSGRRVAALLRAEGRDVRVASRNGEVRFDWAAPATWPAVTDGVGALYLVAPDDPAPLRPFLAAVAEAGVERVVLLSGRGGPEAWRDRFGHAMAVAEEAVRRAGPAWTIVRATNFMQNFTEDLWFQPILDGRLALPSAGVPEPFVDLDDLAAVAARLLTADGHAGRVYELSGPTALTFADAVAAIAAAAGRSISYQDLTPDEYVDELRAAGLDDWVDPLSGLFAVMRDGSFAVPTDDVERLLGRPAGSFADWVARTAPSGIWAAGETVDNDILVV